MSRDPSAESSSSSVELLNIFLRNCERVKQIVELIDKLVPPLESFHTPGVVLVGKLFSKKDVEAWKLDTFPLLAPLS